MISGILIHEDLGSVCDLDTARLSSEELADKGKLKTRSTAPDLRGKGFLHVAPFSSGV